MMEVRLSPTVKQVMTTPVTILTPGQSLRSGIEALRKAHVSGCPVVEPATGEVVGVLSERDVARALHESWSEAHPLGLLDLLLPDSAWSRPDILSDLRQRLDKMLVAQAMTRHPAVIDQDASLAAAAEVMRDRSVNRLPVLSEGQLVGIITRRDLIGAWPSAP